MSLFGIWSAFGFRENPYSQAELKPDETGDVLLAGRDAVVEDVQRRIGSAGTHPSVEGPVGVGKSSMLAVASFRMAKICMQERKGELYLPAATFFQATEDLGEFEAQVYRVLAQTLITYADSFPHVGLDEPDVDELNKWLNSPEYRSWSVEGTVLGSGGGTSRASEPNTTEGFLRSGFPEAVRAQLERCFPSGTGGIICVLDNLELLESAGRARATLDALRDRLFNVGALRWVLCGSRGIVSRARSERLSGIFQAPIQLGPLDYDAAIEAIRRRIEHFGLDEAHPPVTPTGFEFLYRALNSNLRDSLSTAQEFSQWLYTEFLAGKSELPEARERDGLLEAWLAARAEQAFKDANNVQARNWQFFQDLGDRGGRIGSSDYETFDFGVQQQMVSAVSQLVDANLMVRETDPDNATKTVNSITALGWLVYFYRANYEMPKSRSLPDGTP